MISSALCASFKTTACRLRPSAASIAGINFGSTSICATSEPTIDSRKRSGSSKPLRTACEPCARPSPSALSWRRISTLDLFSASVRSRTVTSNSARARSSCCFFKFDSAASDWARSSSSWNRLRRATVDRARAWWRWRCIRSLLRIRRKNCWSRRGTPR